MGSVRLGLSGLPVAGGCGLVWWMWLAWSVLWRAWVGRQAWYGGPVTVGLPSIGACALVWWLPVLSAGSSSLVVCCASRSGVGVALQAWLVFLRWPFVFLSVPVLFPVPGVVALSPLLDWCYCPCLRVVARSVQGRRGRCLVVAVRWFFFRRRAVHGAPLHGCTPLTLRGGRWWWASLGAVDAVRVVSRLGGPAGST